MLNYLQLGASMYLLANQQRGTVCWILVLLEKGKLRFIATTLFLENRCDFILLAVLPDPLYSRNFVVD